MYGKTFSAGASQIEIALHNEDCITGMMSIPDSSVDMILSDLPYGMTDCKWDGVIPTGPLWEQYNRIVKPNGAVLLFAVQPFTTTLINSNPKNYRYNWYWHKNNKTGAPFAKVQPMRCIEEILVFYRKAPTYNPQGLKRLKNPKINKTKVNGVYRQAKNESVQLYTNYPSHLLEFNGVSTLSPERIHPTQKPVALLEYLIRTYTNPGETVLDSCAGSGSTAVACIRTGRNFIGFETDAEYFRKAAERIEAIDR